MLRYLTDENFNGQITRGLMRRRTGLDLVRIQDVGLLEADDPEILAWVGKNNRILVTHDSATVPDYAYAQVAKEEAMAGVFIVNDRLPRKDVIDELLFLDACSEMDDWRNLVIYLPL